MILEASEDQYLQFRDTERHITKGYVAFIRKISNKIVEVAKKNDEVQLILESIPEWNVYVEDNLEKANKIESKPLASDPRSKGPTSNSEEDIEFFFKIKNFN